MNKNKEKGCPFCKIQDDIITRNNFAIAIADKYPVTKDHALIVPLRHRSSFFALDFDETNTCFELVNQVRQLILEKDKLVTGFNVGINDGIDAGQTVFHCHIHLIPRRKGDVTDPCGGVRNIIPSRTGY